MDDNNSCSSSSSCSYETKLSQATRETLMRVDDELFTKAEEKFVKDESPADDGSGEGEDEDKNGKGELSRDDDDDYDDPRAAVERWYADQEASARPPYQEWINQFTFLRVVGKGISPPDGFVRDAGAGEDAECVEEVIAEHGGGGDRMTDQERDMLMRKLLEVVRESHREREAKKKNGAGEAIEIDLEDDKSADSRVASVTKYVAGSAKID